MHGWETRMQLKHYLGLGARKAELSRRFDVSRRTIHYWIESGQLDRVCRHRRNALRGAGHGGTRRPR